MDSIAGRKYDKMVKGFVFGKFYPFHKGHEAMIRFALEHCDYLSVLVCCSNKETVSSAIRKIWIERTFEDISNLEVITFDYDEEDYPNSSESSPEISLKWSAVFRKHFPDYEILITSEPYGYYVAEYMDIKHIPFDMDRIKLPVAASLIRRDIFSYWSFLPGAVKRNLALKVVILGSESTGKSSLTGQLSQHYNCTSVFEAGRDLIDDSTDFSIDDLYLVATEHARLIRKAETGDSPLIVIDTDIHITQSYCNFAFDQKLDVSEDIYNANRADLYLYLNIDVPFVQDGTRMGELQRNRLDLSHRNILKDHNINIFEVSGSWDLRFNKAIQEIDKLIEDRKSLF